MRGKYRLDDIRNRRRSSPFPASRETAANKLKFFDVSDAQIAELEKTRQPRKTLQFLAPMDGFVMEKMVVQGQMVDAGMKLYRLADLSIVWIFAQIYEQDLPYVQLGQEAIVKIASLPDRGSRMRSSALTAPPHSQRCVRFGTAGCELRTTSPSRRSTS